MQLCKRKHTSLKTESAHHPMSTGKSMQTCKPANMLTCPEGDFAHDYWLPASRFSHVKSVANELPVVFYRSLEKWRPFATFENGETNVRQIT